MKARAIVSSLALFAIVSIASGMWQAPLTYNGGQGWDGTVYYRMSEQFARGERLLADAPFVYRPATPFLVATFFPDDLLYGFKVVNILAGALTVVLLASWLASYLKDWKVVALATGLFITQWHAPPRYVFFAPVSVDPWLLVFLLMGLHLMRDIRQAGTRLVWVLSVVTFVGVLFREVAVVLAAAALFADPEARAADLMSPSTILDRLRRRPQLLLPAICGVLGLLVTRVLGTPTGEYGLARAAFTILYQKPAHTYVHAWFVAFGPLIALVLFRYRSAIRLLAGQPFLLVYLLAVCVLAWIGGVDTERFLYWAMPVVYLMIGLAIEESQARWRSASPVVVLVLAQLVSQRVFWTLPDYPNAFITPFPILTIPTNQFQLLDLYSLHGRRLIEFVSLVEYLCLTLVLCRWFSLLERAGNQENPKAAPRTHPAL